MQHNRCFNMAMRYFEEYDLDEWGFQFNNHMKWFGICDWNTATIYMSAPLVELNSVATSRDTILHEIAHVLAGPRAAHHGPRWKKIAANMGVNIAWQEDAATYQIPHRYDVKCPSCGEQWKYMKRVASSRCTCEVPAIWTPTVYHLSAAKESFNV